MAKQLRPTAMLKKFEFKQLHPRKISFLVADTIV